MLPSASTGERRGTLRVNARARQGDTARARRDARLSSAISWRGAILNGAWIIPLEPNCERVRNSAGLPENPISSTIC